MAANRFALDPTVRALLHDLGISVRNVLRRAELPADLLARGPVWLDAAEYFRLWEALDAESNDPNLPAAIGRAFSPELFSPPIFAALCSPNLDIAAARIAQHKLLIGPMKMAVSQDAVGTTLTYSWPAGLTPPQVLGTTELVFWVAMARVATRHHVSPIRISAPLMPPDPDTIADYFGVRMSEGPTQSITFARADATRPFLTENEHLWQFFAPELRRRLADLEEAASTAERVQAALLELLPAGSSTMSAVASHLAVSTRTLQRQLHAEGASYQAVLADTRENLARHYLAHSHLTAAEMAFLLGYDDTNSFYRAFRAWTGTTPDTFRLSSVGSGRPQSLSSAL